MRYLNSPSVLNTIQKNIDYGTVSINKENGPHYDRGKKITKTSFVIITELRAEKSNFLIL